MRKNVVLQWLLYFYTIYNYIHAIKHINVNIVAGWEYFNSTFRFRSMFRINNLNMLLPDFLFFQFWISKILTNFSRILSKLSNIERHVACLQSYIIIIIWIKLTYLASIQMQWQWQFVEDSREQTLNFSSFLFTWIHSFYWLKSNHF